jgi:predicted dehydrogenase
MASHLNRRSFGKRVAMAGAAISAGHLFPSPGVLRAAGTGDKLNCVVVGCGGRGQSHLSAVKGENLLAVTDADEKRMAATQSSRKDGAKVEGFSDYRKMFDKLGKTIDAVFVATPNHHHALPAMIAMQLGKGVYVEKPLCHDIAEARKLAEMAARYKVPTQMGNQGHCSEGYRRLCEYVWAGVIGPITETHSWTNRSNGGRGPRPPTEPVPADLHWDEWIGPAPYRDFHTDLHPHEWHGWYDFGNGSLGNLACHVLDGVYWALKLEHPTAIEAEEVFGGTEERCPTGTTIRWDFPARGDMPAVKAYWYDGRRGENDLGDHKGGDGGSKGKSPRNLPPLLLELQKKYPDEKFDSSGTLYVGEKGILYTACYGGDLHLLPKEKMKEIAQPPKTLPRPQGSFADFLRACREGKNDTAAGFDYSARLTEFTLLGNLAQHAGQGNKVQWDGPNMKVLNLPDLNRFLRREYRSGWQA